MAAALAIAGGTIAAGYLAKRGSDNAVKASTKSNTEAINYTKEQEAARLARYEQEYSAWNAQRKALLQRYGVDTSSMRMDAPPPMMASGMPTVRGTDPRATNALASAAISGQTVADILGQGARPGDWNDWEARGLRTV